MRLMLNRLVENGFFILRLDGVVGQMGEFKDLPLPRVFIRGGLLPGPTCFSLLPNSNLKCKAGTENSLCYHRITLFPTFPAE